MKNLTVLSFIAPLLMLSACSDKGQDATTTQQAQPATTVAIEPEHPHQNTKPQDDTHGEHAHEHQEHQHHEHQHDLPPDNKDTYSVHENHDAHEHGVARLSLSLSEDRVEVLLESPAVNIFTFEHRPSTEQDKQMLEQRRKALENADQFLNFNKEAQCELNSANIDSALFDEEPEDPSGHKDVYASWVYDCANMKQLSAVQTKFFTRFPDGFERIEVEWISDNNASATTLKEDGEISFK